MMNKLSVTMVTLSLAGLLAGCTSDDALGGAAGTFNSVPTTSFVIALDSVPPEAGPVAALVVQRCANGFCEVLQGATGEARGGVFFGVQLTEAPFDVVVFVPDDETWVVGDAFGPGYYALASEIASAEGRLWVPYWEYRTSLDTVVGGNIVPGDERPAQPSVAGVVTDPEGAAIEGATVWVDRQALAVTGADGSFSLSPLPPRDVTLQVAAPGRELVTLSLDSVEPDSQVVVPLPPTDDEPFTFSGVVMDWDTEEPIEGATVETGGQVFTTATDGSFEGVVPAGTYHATVTRAGYTTLITGLGYCFENDEDQTRFYLDALNEELFGTWSYCYSIDEVPPSTEEFNSGTTVPHFDVLPGIGTASGATKQIYDLSDTGVFRSTADGAVELGGGSGTATLYWNTRDRGADRFDLVQAVNSNSCRPQYSGIDDPYRSFELDDEALVRIFEFIGRTRHYYVPDPDSDPACDVEPPSDGPGPDPDPDPEEPTVEEILAQFAGDYPVEIIESGSCSSVVLPECQGFDCGEVDGLSCGASTTLSINAASMSIAFGGVSQPVPTDIPTFVSSSGLGTLGIDRNELDNGGILYQLALVSADADGRKDVFIEIETDSNNETRSVEVTVMYSDLDVSSGEPPSYIDWLKGVGP